jgi:dihydrofolate reductase
VIEMNVILLMAVTADGMIARDSSQIIDWTGKEDKKYFVHITRKSGVMIMGSKTFDMIGKALPGRKNIVMTRDKSRKSHDKDLIFTDKAPGVIIKELHAQGRETAVLIGGTIINTLFLKENLIDEIHVTIVPRFFGKGLPLFNKSFDTQLELINIEKLGQNHILLKYRVQK